MTRLFLTSLALGTALALSACGSQKETETETAAADESAVDPNNPFADLEMRMNERMMAAVGTDAGDTWVRMMIEHHQGAVDMSRIMLEQNPSDDVAQMAQDTIDKQTREIAELRELIEDGTPDRETMALYHPAMADMEQAMMSATGASVEETFLRKMLAHHEGTVALSDVAIENGVTGQVRAIAAKAKSDQQEEAEMISAMLRGEEMAEEEAAPTAAAAPPAPPARSTAAAPRPAATSRQREAPAPAQSADPHAGMNMDNR